MDIQCAYPGRRAEEQTCTACGVTVGDTDLANTDPAVPSAVNASTARILKTEITFFNVISFAGGQVHVHLCYNTKHGG